MLLRLILLALIVATSASRGLGQSMIVAKPVSDEKGMIAFQITEVLKVEGEWKPPLLIGDIIYPAKRQKAHPIMRFGEAVVIALTEPNNRTKWQGLHVHNGCIPALQGKPLEEMQAEIVRQAKEQEQSVASGTARGPSSKHTAVPSQAGPEKFAICPICKQRHIRIK